MSIKYKIETYKQSITKDRYYQQREIMLNCFKFFSALKMNGTIRCFQKRKYNVLLNCFKHF